VRRHADTSKAAAKLGFEARVRVGEGIPRTVAWARENLVRIEAAMAKHRDRLEAR
jgi:nucleoside-diphosphate-sugar epimerase